MAAFDPQRDFWFRGYAHDETTQSYTVPAGGVKADGIEDAIAFMFKGGSSATAVELSPPSSLDDLRLNWESPTTARAYSAAVPGDVFTMKIGSSSSRSGTAGGWNGGGSGAGSGGFGGGGATEIWRNGTLILVAGGKGGRARNPADSGAGIVFDISAGLPAADEDPRRPFDASDSGAEIPGDPGSFLPTGGTWTPGDAGGAHDGGDGSLTISGGGGTYGAGGGGSGFGGGAAGSTVGDLSGPSVAALEGRTGGYAYNPAHVIEHLQPPGITGPPDSYLVRSGYFDGIVKQTVPELVFEAGFENWNDSAFGFVLLGRDASRPGWSLGHLSPLPWGG